MIKNFLKKYKFAQEKHNFPLCNNNHDTCPKFGSFRFILCWRCTSITLGSLLGYLFPLRINNIYTLIISLLIFSLTFIDGYLNYYTLFKSTNLRRISTGILSGYFFSVLLYSYYNRM